MPTYEYRCDQCDRNFDVVQSFEDDPLTRCPTCDAPVRKVFGSVGIVFKGTGFYKTDSRDGGRPKESARTEKGDGEDGDSRSSEKRTADSSPSGGGTEGGDKKGADTKSPADSAAGKGKDPAPATSTSS